MENRRLNFVFDQDARETLHAFAELFTIRVTLDTFERYFADLKLEYPNRTSGGKKPNSGYCGGVIQDDLGLLSACLACDKENIAKAREHKKTISYKCHAGMNDVVIPIIVGDEAIGFVMMGQFRTTDEVPVHISTLWEKQNGNPEELNEAFCKAPFIHPDRLKSILKIFSFIIESVVSAKFSETSRSDIVTQLIRYMQEHPKDHLALDEAAEMVCSSKSTLCHLFKDATGKSFKQYQIDLKLDKAQNDLRSKSDITVNEVATSLGYTDPLYFSKIYKKHKQKSPSEEIPSYAAESTSST